VSCRIGEFSRELVPGTLKSEQAMCYCTDTKSKPFVGQLF